MQSANSWNDPAEEGTEYLCIKVWMKNIGDIPFESINVYNFTVVSDGSMFDTPFIVDPDPSFSIDGLFPGGELEGWATYLIKEGDPDPLFSFYADPIATNSLVQLVRP